MTVPPPSGAARSRHPRDPRGRRAHCPRPAGPCPRRHGSPFPPSAAPDPGPGLPRPPARRSPAAPPARRSPAQRRPTGGTGVGGARPGLSAPPGSAPPLPAALVQGRAALPSLPPGSGRHAPQGSGGEAGRERTGPGHKGGGGRWPREAARSGAEGARAEPSRGMCRPFGILLSTCSFLKHTENPLLPNQV
ncbi:basic proline-rich protein-like [Prinia subflava]|uniref:basic proline-rich protein-like n=1 Tax=Prinia subflava TaxID=208062 RepID=UPI002FE398D8